MIKKLQDELDEADRRAGAAERKNELLEEVESCHLDWLRQAKIDAGYPDGISFDQVWMETLSLAEAFVKEKTKS